MTEKNYSDSYNLNTTNQTSLDYSDEIVVKFRPYETAEILTAILAVVGNCLVIIVFYCEKRLRTASNYQIISLAVADLLLGALCVPIAILVRKFFNF